MVHNASLGLESLESRLNLSTLQGITAPEAVAGSMVQERSTLQSLLSRHSLNKFLELEQEFDTGGGRNTSSTTLLAPSNLTATASSTAITLKWTDNATNETGYQILRSTNGTSFSQIASISRNSSTFTDTTAAAGVNYTYQIRCVAKNVTSAPSNTATASIAAAPTPTPVVTLPAAPGTATFSNITETSVTLNWTDLADNESGYRVYRADAGGAYNLVAALDANTTSWNDASLTAGSTYSYIVATWNSAGQAVSAANSVTTATPTPAPAPAPVTLPAAPTAATFSNITQTSVTLNWTDLADNESGYRVYRADSSGTYNLVAVLGIDATSWQDTTLTAGSTYSYIVANWNSAGQSVAPASSVTTAAIPTQTPAPAPAPVPSTGGVTFTTRNMTSFTELVITGTSGNDSILVTQSNGVLTITANGQSTTYTNTFGDIVIKGLAGDDTLTVDSSVNIAALIYSGTGNDVVKNLTTGKATIVTIGAGTHTVTGNGKNTSFWVNTGDTVNATSTEINLGGVNRVSDFYQPWTTSTGSADYITTNLDGQNLRDPSDTGATIRLNNSSFWGLGPTMNDVNQGGIADCYFLAPIASLANTEQAKLFNMGVDLGDGTYAVRFVRNGVTSFVRVDGDLAAGGNAYGVMGTAPGASGNLWASIFEKAYAFFRSGANSYSSLNFGSGSATFRDFGLSATAVAPTSGATTVMNLINSEISSGKAIVASTLSGITSGAPLIASHVYTILGAFTDSSGNVMIRMRNPWGYDGAGSDGNWSDGIITLDYATFSKNFGALSYVTA